MSGKNYWQKQKYFGFYSLNFHFQICLEDFQAGRRIFQCLNGHWICEGCKGKLLNKVSAAAFSVKYSFLNLNLPFQVCPKCACPNIDVRAHDIENFLFDQTT